MTKQQATERAAACFQFNHPTGKWEFTPYRLVEALEYLGMLKLDEPKSMKDKFNDAWCSMEPSERTFPNVLRALEDHGLKLVEK